MSYHSQVPIVAKAFISIDAAHMRAVVCAWCPDKAEADHWALAHSLSVSHGLCASCRDAFVEQIKCERASRNPFAR